jgi:hypothetical protein
VSKKKSGLGSDAGSLFQPTGQQADKPSKQRDSVTAKQPKSRIGKYAADPDKVKVTFYLGDETADSLDLEWPKLKQQAGSRKRLVTKSLIVEAALHIVLDDWKANGDESALAKILAQLDSETL